MLIYVFFDFFWYPDKGRVLTVYNRYYGSIGSIYSYAYFCWICWPPHNLTCTYIMLTGQSLDNYLQLCWELFLDSLLFHGSGCVLYISIMENEQCKPRTYYLSLSETAYPLLICSICWWQVPHTTFLLTHVCFLFYHVASNMTLRRLRHYIADLPEKIRWATEAAWILALAYFIAYLETLAISNVCFNKQFFCFFIIMIFV